MSNRQIRGLIPAIVEFARLQDAADRQLWTYSSGMTARLGFAVAALVEFELLLLDEAFERRRPAFRERCADTLQRLRNSGATMIIVSRGSENLRKLCDRAMWLHNGTLRANGPARAIVNLYEQSIDPSDAVEGALGAERE